VRRNGTVYILEALRLSEGEKNYIVLYPEALEAMFAPSCENGAIIDASYSTPFSFSNTPLMEATFTVAVPENVMLDVGIALEKVIEIDRNKLIQHKSGVSVLDGIDYAFVVNNLANAIIGLHTIRT